jgi:hypothetical protein
MIVYVLLYLVVSAAFCHWLLINIYSRSENPHWQIQTENPIMFMLCITFGWLAFIPLFISLLLTTIAIGSLDEAFKEIAKKLDNDD